jgi:hypothetical protein
MTIVASAITMSLFGRFFCQLRVDPFVWTPFKSKSTTVETAMIDDGTSGFLNENQQDFLPVDDSSNHERKHKVQSIANDYSILVLGMELLTGSWIRGLVMGIWSFIWMRVTIIVTIRATMMMHFKPRLFRTPHMIRLLENQACLRVWICTSEPARLTELQIDKCVNK